MTAVPQMQHMDAAPVAQATARRGEIYGVLIVIAVIPAMCIAGNQAGLLQILFPALSFAAGAFLFMRSKPHYVGLVFWLWFATPFFGRMADYQSGWVPSNPVLLAPYLTAAISGITLVSSIKRLGERGALPYVCALIAILYGLVIGLLSYPLFNVLQALLNWIVPVMFGFFIYRHRELYPEFRKAIEMSFLSGILLMGMYGIYQFFDLPDWDRAWMVNVSVHSFGEAEEMVVRVFSTMNAPAVFAAITMCGLLILFNLRGNLRLLSAACGFVALMLTISRASWLGLLAGVAYLLVGMEMRQRARLAMAVVACAVVMVGLYQIPPIGDLIGKRIDTLTAPSQDVSYSSRIEGHQQALHTLAGEPFGEGMGSTDTVHFTAEDDSSIGPHDSTLLEFLYSLGWTGTLIYGTGLVWLTVKLIRSGRRDPFVLSSNAILIGFAAQCMLNSVMIGVLGFMVWTFASMSLAQADRVEPAEESNQLNELEPEPAPATP